MSTPPPDPQLESLQARQGASPDSIELERIATDLLIEDLGSDDTLAWAVLFDAPLREQLLSLLDGQRACWNRTALARRALARPSRSGTGTTGTAARWP